MCIIPGVKLSQNAPMFSGEYDCGGWLLRNKYKLSFDGPPKRLVVLEDPEEELELVVARARKNVFRLGCSDPGPDVRRLRYAGSDIAAVNVSFVVMLCCFNFACCFGVRTVLTACANWRSNGANGLIPTNSISWTFQAKWWVPVVPAVLITAINVSLIHLSSIPPVDGFEISSLKSCTS